MSSPATPVVSVAAKKIGQTNLFPAGHRKGDRVVYKELTGRIWRAAIVMNTARNGLSAGIYCYKRRVCEHPNVVVELLRVPSDQEKVNLADHWARIEDYAASSRGVLLLVLIGVHGTVQGVT
jgi:hypothetical protein